MVTSRVVRVEPSEGEVMVMVGGRLVVEPPPPPPLLPPVGMGLPGEVEELPGTK